MASVPRRTFVALGAAALLGVSACGTAAPPSGQAPAQSQGPWTWTDDRGKNISSPQRPRRVVAQSAAAAALWDFGVQLSGKGLVEIIDRYGRLAGALGADLGAAPVVAARKRFEAASAALKTLAAERPDLKVMIVTATPDSLYVAYLPDHPDIEYWSELGLNIVSPEKPTEREGGFWEVLSWENADKYQADVILVDARSQSMKIDEMAGKPTWAKLPAVKAGQLYPWHAAERYSYLGYAQVMEELKADLEKARDDVVK